MSRINLAIFSLLFFTFCPLAVSAQDTLSLDQSYQDLLRRSETYEAFKVIRQQRLDDFWGKVTDSLASKEQMVSALRIQLSEQEEATAQAKQQADEAKVAAEQLQGQVDTINFLGLPMGKGTYHLLVWSIILILGVLLALIAIRFRNSDSLTQRARSEYDSLHAECESHKEKARKQQIKLKRELQTAVNELEALKRGEV